MPLRIAIHGAAGRMGRRVLACAARETDIAVTALLERAGHPDLGKDGGTLAGMPPSGVALSAEWPAGFDVAIDFSSSAGAARAAAACARIGAAVVVGTTGLDAAAQTALREASRRVPVLVSPNMSVGANLLFWLAAQTAARTGPTVDVEIVETHHRGKADAPSGTALHLAAQVRAARGGEIRAGRAGAEVRAAPGEIGVHAVRLADVVGEHTVSFAWEGERIELTHRATDRDAFARGALRAARLLHGRPPGLLSLVDLLRPDA